MKEQHMGAPISVGGPDISTSGSFLRASLWTMNFSDPKPGNMASMSRNT